MNRIARLFLAVIVAGAAMLSANPLVAQRGETSAGQQTAATSGDAIASARLTEVESALAAVEADSEIDESEKELLRTKYARAIESLKEAASYAAKAAEYRESLTQAPDTAAELQAQLEALPSVQSAGAVTAPSDPNELQRELAAQQATRAALSERLSTLDAGSSLDEQRPAEIGLRIPEAERELADARRQLASPDLADDITSPSRSADMYLLRARELKLASELEMLKQEQLSQSVRRNLQQAQRALLTRQVENASAAVAAYERLVDRSVTKVARDISARAEELRLEVPQDDPEAVALAAEVQELASQLESVLQDRQRISAAKGNVTAKLQRLGQRYDSIKRQLELGQPGVEMAQVLIDLRALLNTQMRKISQMGRWPTIGQTRLAAVQVDIKIEAQSEWQEQFSDRSNRGASPPGDPSSAAVQDLVAARREVLDMLQKQYLDLIPLHASLESETRQYLKRAGQTQADITGQLFWIRISPPLSASTFSEVPAGLRWVLGRQHWLECGRALGIATTRSPLPSALVALLAIVLLVMRGRIITALRRTADGVGRVSTDRFGLTGRAVFLTALLALPIPLLIGFVALAFAQADAPSTWLRDINQGMPGAVLVVSAAFFIAACCCPGGLGAAHFGWRSDSLSLLRRASRWFALVYVPLVLLAYGTLSSESGRFFHNLGRASFLFAHAWLFVVVARRLFFSDGIHTGLVRDNPSGPVARSRPLWSIVVSGAPVALMVLAGLGYTMTAFDLSITLVLTLIIIVGGVILYSLALRWFRIKHRTLALAEALERRRARQEAAAGEGHEEDSGEIVSVDDDGEQELDLDSIDGQTRYLLRLLSGLAVAGAVLSLWSTTLPLIPYLDTITIPMTVDFSLLDLAKAALIVAVTWLVTKNLPGMLELAILRATSMDTGTRHAITTICQYTVVIAGFIFLLNTLNLDWAKFGWIAGGLSVGIGFGLQEVVANFVCGVILLFERPIRVGDFVTVEGTSGTVTRIDMRATTITNRDRQEFVVPNKILITNTLLNWTLSAPLNRIVIPVGVAYGSDTEQARQIMLDVAAEHPRILDDPVPQATFEQFDESSLNLVLRAFIPNLENRVRTITDLHTEIDKRFAAAGIEIAFPQRDVHIRNRAESSVTDARECRTDGEASTVRGSERNTAK